MSYSLSWSEVVVASSSLAARLGVGRTLDPEATGDLLRDLAVGLALVGVATPARAAAVCSRFRPLTVSVGCPAAGNVGRAR